MKNGSKDVDRPVERANASKLHAVIRRAGGSNHWLSSFFVRPAMLGMLAFALLLPGFSAETCAHTWMAPKEEAARENPKADDPGSAAAGRELFAVNCAFCHGEGAEGLSAKETGLELDTPNLLLRLENHPEGDLHWKIRTGRGEMPKFGDELSDGEIWDIINYLHKLQK